MFKKQKRIVQGELWIDAAKVALPEGCAFYDKLNAMLEAVGFDEQVHALCQPYYRMDGPGHPGVDPAVYFRILLIGFFEGIRSERALATRCADSLMLRRFLRYQLDESVPDHSTLSVIRHRFPVDVFHQVFTIMHPALASLGLIRGAHIAMDTSVIEANASMRNLRNRCTGEKYREYVRRLAKDDGVNPRDEAAVSRHDRKRKNRKTSNNDWQNPHDPDAKVGPTKHGETRMIYKPEHVVDMDTGAIIDAQVLPGDTADATEVAARLAETERRMMAVMPIDELPIETLTADKGYHSAANVEQLSTAGIAVNIPDRVVDRKMEQLTPACQRALRKSATLVKSRKGKALLRKRGMYVERSFAHVLDAGGMRRTTLRGRENVQKRHSIASLGYNLSLVLLTVFGVGTPKQAIAGATAAGFSAFSRVAYAVHALLRHLCAYWWRLTGPSPSLDVSSCCLLIRS
jgi:transposase